MFNYSEDLVDPQEYEVVGEVGAGLILVESRYGRQIWVECTQRLNTHKVCELCGDDQFHLIAYRPINNQKNRSHRFCLKCLKEKMVIKPVRKKIIA